MEAEEWRPVLEYPGLEASNLGRIRSYRWTLNRFHKELATEPRIKATQTHECGYLVIGIGHSKTRRVHVLVAAAFIGPKPKGLDVNHKDGIKTNNRPENLEYVTRSENLKHAFRLGRATSPFTGRIGEKHFMAKLAERDVIAIREKFSNGVSRRALVSEYGVSNAAIYDITARRSWKHLSP